VMLFSAGALHGDILRIFQRLGLLDQFMRQIHSQKVQFVTQNGKPLFAINPTKADDMYDKIVFFYQPEMEVCVQ